MRAEHPSYSRGREDESDHLGELRIPLHGDLCRLAAVDDVASVRTVQVASCGDVRRQPVSRGEGSMSQ